MKKTQPTDYSDSRRGLVDSDGVGQPVAASHRTTLGSMFATACWSTFTAAWSAATAARSDATGDAEQHASRTANTTMGAVAPNADRRVDLEGTSLFYLDKPNSDNASCPRPPGRWGIQALWVVP